MVILHVPHDRTSLDREVEQRLRDLVVAHCVQVTDAGSAPAELPAMLDGGRWVPATQLPAYMDELAETVASWRKFQSDACYVEDDGSIC